MALPPTSTRLSDIDAALAMARLSESLSQTSQRNVSVMANQPGNIVTLSRGSHVRTAVMPSVQTRVLKRRLSPVNADMPRYKDVFRTVNSERGCFATSAARRVADGTADIDEIGLLTRTCRPIVRPSPCTDPYSRTYGGSTYPSDTSLNESTVSVNSRQSRLRHVDLDQHRAVDHIWSDGSRRNVTCQGSIQMTCGAAAADTVSNVQQLASQNSVHADMISCRMPSMALSRNDKVRPCSGSALLDAYNLGQKVAASQFFFAKPAGVMNIGRLSQNIPNVASVSRAQRRCVVDSVTMSKVKSGRFGCLSVIQSYVEQLDHTQALQEAHIVQQTVNDDDVVLDLSMDRTRLLHGNLPLTSIGLLTTDRQVLSSRSCCSSPVAADINQQSSTVDHRGYCPLFGSQSLPNSPYPARGQSQCSAWSSGSDDDCTIDVKVQVTEALPDSYLPLKKRRLHTTNMAEVAAGPAGSNVDTGITNDSDTSAAPAGNHSATAILSAVNYDLLSYLRLHDTVASGDLTAVSHLIHAINKLGVSVDYYNRHMQTALHVAVLTEQPDMVERLVIAGAAVDVVDSAGCNSMHLAAALPHRAVDCLDRLTATRRRLDLDATTADGTTALHKAVISGNLLAAKYLLDIGADVNRCDVINGHSALLFAFARKDAAMMRLLVSRGASCDRVTPCGTGVTKLTSACSSETLNSLNDDRNFLRLRTLPTCCPTG